MDELRISQLRKLRALLAKKEALTREEESEKEQLLTELSITLGLPESEIIEQAVVPELATSGALEPAILAFLMGEREAALSMELEQSLNHLSLKQRDELIFLLVKKNREKLLRLAKEELKSQPSTSEAIAAVITGGKPEYNLSETSVANAESLLNNYLDSTNTRLTPPEHSNAVMEIAENLVVFSQYSTTPRPKEIEELKTEPPVVTPEDFGAALRGERPAEKETQMVKKPNLAVEPETPEEQLENIPVSKDLSLPELALITQLAVDRVIQKQTPLLKLDEKLDDLFSLATPETQLEYIESVITEEKPQTKTTEEKLTKPKAEPIIDPEAYFVLDQDTFEAIVNDEKLIRETLPNTDKDLDEISARIVSKPYKEDPQNDPLTHKINSDQQNYRDTIKELVTLSAVAPIVIPLVAPTEETLKQVEELLRRQVVKDLDQSAYLEPVYHAAFISNVAQALPGATHPVVPKILGRSQNIDAFDIYVTAQKILREQERTLTGAQSRELTKIVNDLRKTSPEFRQEVRPRPSGFTDGFFKVVRRGQNSIAEYLPRGARPLLSPFGSLSNRWAKLSADNFIAQYRHLSPSVLRSAGQNLGRIGFNKTAQFLSQRALMVGGRLAALKMAALALPGGPLLSAAIEVGSQLLKQGGKIFNGFAKAIWGDKVRKIDVASAMGLAGASVMSGFIALGVGASAAMASIFAAAGSAFMTLFIAAAGTFIFYIAALNIAPILSTLVHLESGLGGSTLGGRGPVGLERVNRPGIDCFVISDDKDPWPDIYLANMERVINYLVSNYGDYTDKLCTGGDIRIAYSSIVTGYGGELLGDGYMTIYPDGIRHSFGSNLYTLAHESGHFFDDRFPGIWNQFRLQQPWVGEGFIHTYPLRKSNVEDFAEMIGVYISGPSYPKVDVLGRYPKHAAFAQTYIFN